jgi:phosphoglycolate phosphatase/putative hydrolase of the HAD superfamily
MLAERLECVMPGAQAAPSVRNPLDPGRRVRAVLFDLDGTLYRQRPVRGLMALELAALAFSRPLQAPVSWRVLSEFRRAQETLRRQDSDRGAAGQLEITAQRTGRTVEQVEEIVTEWMMERPLKYLLRCRADGLLPLLDFLNQRVIKVGVLSDYPAEMKLKALGVGGRFSLVLSASDPDVGAFKPHPRGFLAAAARWQVDASEVLVVGDRPDADAAGASAAGMPCVIIGARNHSSGDFLWLNSFERLRDVLDDDHGR